MGSVRIMTSNFVDTDVVSNSFVSSEQAAFPVSNLYNKQRRSKVWRSNGYWNITSANNTLIIRETTSVNLSVLMPIDEYNSNALFFAAFKTALEDAGGSTYTVTQNSLTKKINIASNLVGGGGIFEIIWTHANSAGLAASLGYITTEDDAGASNYTADQLRIGTDEWIKWDMGISTNPMGLAMIGLRNSPIPISPSATIKLQGSETDAWTTPSYETTLTYNDAIIAVFDETGLHTEALRYWRLLIRDLDNPFGYVEIGSVFLGDFYQSTRGAVQFPFSADFIDRSNTVFSEGGQTFSDIRPKSERFSINWFGLTKEEKEELEAHFNDVGVSTPFFVAFDPNSAFSSNDDFYTRYVKYESPPAYRLETPNNYSMSMSLREEL